MLLLVAIVAGACEHKPKGSFVVKVTYKNAGKLGSVPNDSLHHGTGTAPVIVLEEMPFGGTARPVLLDSALLGKNEGYVELKGNGREEGVYQVVVENGPVLLLVNDASKIEVSLDLARKDNSYTVEGSEGSRRLQDFITHYDVKAGVIGDVFSEIDSLKQFGGSDSLLIAATNRKNEALSRLNDYMKDFISKTEDPAVSLFVLGLSSRSLQVDEFEKALDAAVKKFPEYKTLAQLKTTYEMQRAREQTEQAAHKQGAWVGKQVPDLALPSIAGNIISIRSFRGKYLLVDFWASWCGPCRHENPNVVKAYNEFKNKNFTVLGVSLDTGRVAWAKAIKDDQLSWTHISDLQMWNSKAVELFQFDGIPYNLLVDPQGKVIAEGLRGEELEQKLNEVLK